ncbi:MAG: hypothetical protein BWY74_03883 [Firmicutes bacterium ADurb.Bin419]|nr:MAG: hypothetical protein BWY74_03883 [Firmicutes bacterium ADurb.Bin419]
MAKIEDKTKNDLIATIKNKCKEFGIIDTQIVERVSIGLERYRKPDGSHNHKQPGWCGVRESLEEVADAFALLIMEQLNVGLSKRGKKILHNTAMLYRDLLAEYGYKNAKGGSENE